MKEKKTFKALIKEFVLQEEIRLSSNSIDDQVDSILLRFESDCIVPPEGIEKEPDVNADPAHQREGRLDSVLDMLNEKKDDDEEDDDKKDDKDDDKADDKPDEDTAAPDAGGGPSDTSDEELSGDQDDVKPDVESDPLKPKIDVHKFTGKVARLASNYESLLDVSIGIANRAYNYLMTNYSRDVADEFSEILEREFNIELEHPDGSEPEEAPMAIGAAASGLGGGG